MSNYTNRISNKILFYLLTISLTTLSYESFAQDGEKLFKANCASCHKIDKKLIGPALQGARERWEDEANLISWVKNSQGYLEDNPGDGYASKLFEKYNNSIMPDQAVSNEEVVAILDYVDAWQPPVKEVVVVAETASGPTEDYTLYWLLGFAVVFLIVAKVLLGIRRSVSKMLAEVDGAEVAPRDKLGAVGAFIDWFRTNNKLATTVTVLLIIFALVKGFDALLGIGVFQGYQPTQPIKFSHKIHAGENAINCVYCHHSAEKGKASGIPSVNVCMNCHKGISEGKRYGTEEIAKIYEAAGWNTETSQYDKEQKPIKWVRIHNLPDFAYFNHSQHVVVGGQECQTCHGPIEEMDEVYQYSELTMGWCINCHRETKVQMKGNGYYDKLSKDLKKIYKEEGVEDFTVEHIGGLECAKCHY